MPDMTDNFTIGGRAIAAGERATIDIPITDLSTHTPMTMPVQVVRGRKDGARLFVSAAVHGDEINGVEIIRRILKLPGLKKMLGTLIAVPIVNAFGFISHSRYLPDRRDLNRSFPGSQKGSLAARLAHTFGEQIVANSSHGIDLHTGAVHRGNYPQIRANLDDPEADRMARAFGVPLVINAGFRDGSLRAAAARRNVPVIVYEAGEALRFDEFSIRAGVKGVLKVMWSLGMLPRSRRRPGAVQPMIARSSSWVRAPLSGVFRANIELGERVEPDTVLAYVSDPFGENEVALTPKVEGVVIGRSYLPIVHEGDALFHIARFEGTQADARSLEEFAPDYEYAQGMTAEISGEAPIV